MKNLTKGFTLIELLVVISIISLISSIALASVNVARAKAANASIQQNLATVRLQSAIYYDNNGNYGTAGAVNGACSSIPDTLFSDVAILAALSAAGVANGTGLSGATCNWSGAGWVVFIPLKNQPNEYWCTDSAGAFRRSYIATYGDLPLLTFCNVDPIL